MKNDDEIRLDEKGKPDDIVISNIDFVHLERMDDSHWWLGLYRGEKRITFWIGNGDSENPDCPVTTKVVENDLKIKRKKL